MHLKYEMFLRADCRISNTALWKLSLALSDKCQQQNENLICLHLDSNVKNVGS